MRVFSLLTISEDLRTRKNAGNLRLNLCSTATHRSKKRNFQQHINRVEQRNRAPKMLRVKLTRAHFYPREYLLPDWKNWSEQQKPYPPIAELEKRSNLRSPFLLIVWHKNNTGRSPFLP